MARFRVGVDENGLGPRLGPMIVTGVLARVTDEGFAFASKKPRGGLAKRLGDSKELMAHGDAALGEAWTRALVARGCGREGHATGDVDELIHAIASEERHHLRSPCPSHVEAQCWSARGEEFVAEPELLATIHKDIDKLASRGVEIVSVRTRIVCAKRLNEGVDRGLSRFDVDLHAMESLVLDFATSAGAEVFAVCGKVGGYDNYSDVFGPLAGRLHTVLEQGRARSAYRFPGVGDLAFVRDGDANDVLVSLASLVGKWVREAMMARVVRFYRGHLPELEDASGYHDPVTRRFVNATKLVRKREKIPEECFERRRLDQATPADR